MNLTVEDIKILYHLLNQDDYITSDELSSLLSWNHKKIQQMLNALNYEIEEYGRIESRKNRGYRLIVHSEECRNALIEQIISIGNIEQTLNERRVCIILYLLFSKEYRAMDAIAEDLYISKTTVFEEIGNIKRWFDRIKELTIDVNPVKGCAVAGGEFNKRFLCANLISRSVISQIGLSEQYQKLYCDTVRIRKKETAEYLLKNNISLSGEQYNVLVKFIAAGVLREAMGFHLAAPDDEMDESAIGRYCGQLFGISDSESEQAEENKNRIAAYISVKLGFDVSGFFDDSLLFLPDTSHLHIANYYDKQIIKKYPLEVHLVSRAFLNVLGWQPPRSDMLMIVYLLAIGLRGRKYFRKIRAVLIGDIPVSVMRNNMAYLKQLLPFEPESFDVMPSFEFKEKKETVLADRDLIFTHQYDLKLKHTQMIYVPSILTKDLEHKIRDEIYAFEKRNLLLDLDKLIADASRAYVAKINALTDVISEEELKNATPLMYEKNSLCLISEGSENRISVISLKKEVKERNHFIRKIIIVRYDENDKEKQYFFDQAAMLLN